MNLTKSAIDRGVYEGIATQARDGSTSWSRCVLWDSQVRGLGLRITPAGKKSFVCRYRAGSRQRQMTLGPYGVLTLRQARDRAKQLMAAVLQGEDPLAERQATKRVTTVEELAYRYLVEHAEVKKKAASVQGDRQMIRDYVVPNIGRLSVTDVASRDVMSIHHSLREKPYAANRVLALLSKIFTLSEKWGLRPNGSNPCRHVEKFKERKRERYLSPEEFGRLAEALANAERSGQQSPYAIGALRLLILTGCRLREILHLRWEHVDLDQARLFLPDSKTGSKTVYLSTAAIQVLVDLPRTEGNPWVVEGKKVGSHLVDLKGPWAWICEEAALQNLRIHDLRHSFAAVGAGLGLSLPVLGKLLGHTQPQTTARYAHLAANPMQEAAEQIGVALEMFSDSAPGQRSP